MSRRVYIKTFVFIVLVCAAGLSMAGLDEFTREEWTRPKSVRDGIIADRAAKADVDQSN